MKITVYGYKESFLFTPSVKVYQDGRKLGEVSAKGALVLDNIAPGSVIKFKCGIRSTECVVSDPNIVLSFNRMTGCLEALATIEGNHSCVADTIVIYCNKFAMFLTCT